MKFTKQALLVTFFTFIPTYYVHPMLPDKQEKEMRQREEKRSDSFEGNRKRNDSGSPVKLAYVVKAVNAVKAVKGASKEKINFVRGKTSTKPAIPSFDYLLLNGNQDVKKTITNLICTTGDDTAKDLGSAAASFKKMGYVSKEFHESVNDENNFPAHMLFLKKYGASNHETCRALGTKPAIKQLLLQNSLRKFILDAATSSEEDETTTTSLENKKTSSKLTQLKEDGADLNFTRTNKKITPLIELVCIGDLKLTKEILELGADPEKADNGGNHDGQNKTPLEYAKTSANPEMCKLIEDAIIKKQKLASTTNFIK